MSDKEMIVQQLILTELLHPDGQIGFRLQAVTKFNWLRDLGLLAAANAELNRMYITGQLGRRNED